ncbi:hypothetical protein MRX96_014848 [Rhipicephalus microplus]
MQCNQHDVPINLRSNFGKHHHGGAHIERGNQFDFRTDTTSIIAVVLGVVIALGVIAIAVTVITLPIASNSHEETVSPGVESGVTEKERDATSGPTVAVPDIRTKTTAASRTSKSPTSTTGATTGHATEEPFTAPETTDVEAETTALLPTTRTPKSESKKRHMHLCNISEGTMN